MNETHPEGFQAGFELGKLYSEVQEHLYRTGESEDGPLARTLLAAINAIGSSPNPGPDTQAVIDAWNRD